MEERSVKVFLRGGLGNQLFQYGAGVALANRNKSKLLIDVSLLPSESGTIDGVTRWPSQISEFHHEGTLVRRQFPAKHRARLHGALLQVDRKLGDNFPGLLGKVGRFSNELSTNFTRFESLTAPRLVLNSYCNSPRFFLDYGDQIRNSIRTLRQPSPAFLELTSIVAKTKPLAVHVRLGDYKNLSKIYGSVDPDYFARAIDLQMALSGEREIWLFSDEPHLARQLLGNSEHNAGIQTLLGKLTSLETILIMSSCLGLVASNSTFSWWAAYLNLDKQAPAIFPRPFFARSGPAEPKDWLQVNWLQLGRNPD
jgi:hypothetical protein